MPEPDFPTRFSIFPLPNVVLFPGAYLPLHVFEPRYRAMASDTLAGDGVVGMVLIKPGEDMMRKRAPIFEVGCAGQVIDSRELPDGRYNMVLRGVCRFRVLDEEEGSAAYRSVHAELLPDPRFEELDADVRTRMSQRCEVLQQRMLELAQTTAPESVDLVRSRMRELDPVSLAHAVSFGLDCNPLEKQSLVECDDPLTRLEILLGLMELRQAELRLPGGSETVN